MSAQWLAMVRHRDSTRKRTKGILERHLLPAFGNCPLPAVTRSMVNEQVRKWEDGGLKPRTIDRHIAVLTAIFNAAVADDHLTKTPVHRIIRPVAGRPHRHALDAIELRRLLKAAEGHYYPFIYLAVSTGCRISELLHLRIGDVDLCGQTLVVRSAKTRAGERTIFLSSEDARLIRRHLDDTTRHCAMSDDRLFVTPKLRPLNYSNFRNRVFLRMREAAGLPQLTIHDLRRTNATLLVERGILPKDVQVRLGHTDIRTTLNLYAESTREGRRLAAETIYAALQASLETDPSFAVVA